MSDHSYSNLHDVTNSITEIPQVRVQLLEWQVTLHLSTHTTACTGVGKQLHTLPSHPTLGEPQSFAKNTANNSRHW